MFKIGNYESMYKTKEVFDIFFCHENCPEKTVEFATDIAHKTVFSIDKENEHFILEIDCGQIGNIEDYFHLLTFIKRSWVDTIYLRGTKRMIIGKKQGEELPLCLKIFNINHCEVVECGTKSDGEGADFKIKIYFDYEPQEINADKCPMFDYDTQSCKKYIKYKDKMILI